MSIVNVGAAENDGTGDPWRDAFRKLNAVGGGVISRTTDDPASPSDGDFYIVPTSATGAFAGQDDNLAWYNADTPGWEFTTTPEGFQIWVRDTDERVEWDGSGWQLAGGLADAPADGNDYVRRDNAWEEANYGSGGGAGPAFAGFRAVRLATPQTFSAATDAIYNSAVFDTESGYNTTTGIYTVPSGLDGEYMAFVGALQHTGSSVDLSIAIFINGAETARQRINSAIAQQVSTGAVLVASGDEIKVVIRSYSGSRDMQASPNSFFAGHTVRGGSSPAGSGATEMDGLTDFDGDKTLFTANDVGRVIIVKDVGGGNFEYGIGEKPPFNMFFDYTGSPSGVETLGRFVPGSNITIDSGASGAFWVDTNPTAAATINIRLTDSGGTNTIGTVAVATDGTCVVNIVSDTDIDAGDLLFLESDGAEDFVDLIGSLNGFFRVT